MNINLKNHSTPTDFDMYADYSLKLLHKIPHEPLPSYIMINTATFHLHKGRASILLIPSFPVYKRVLYF